MSLKSTTAALAETLEHEEEYADECEAAGRRQEAASTRARVARLKMAQDEIAALKKAATAVTSCDTEAADTAVCEPAMERYLEAMDLFAAIAKETK